MIPTKLAKDGWYEDVTRVPSPHYTKLPDRVSGQDHIIVLHHTGGKSHGALRAAQWFADPSSEVSAHFVIGGDGHIVQCVSVLCKAWHAGKSSYRGREGVNEFSFGIELANNGRDPFPEPQLQALDGLLLELGGTFDFENIVGHREICMPPGRKPDPHDGFPIARFRPEDPVWGEKQKAEVATGVEMTAKLRDDLTVLLNRHGYENHSNTPDYILADVAIAALEAYSAATRLRDQWYSISPAPGWSGKEE